MKFFTTPNSKNIIATLRIVTIKKSKLAFLLILYFHAFSYLLSATSKTWTQTLDPEPEKPGPRKT